MPATETMALSFEKALEIERMSNLEAAHFNKINTEKIAMKLPQLDIVKEIHGKKQLENFLKEKLVPREVTMTEKFAKMKEKAPLYVNHQQYRGNWIKKFDQTLGAVPGYHEVKLKTVINNLNKARGHFSELIRAYRTDRAGSLVRAINKLVKTNLSNTDIDILAETKDGRNMWIENKDVKNVSFSNDFKRKIDKMADGLKNGVIDIKTGQKLHIDEAVFVNKKGISDKAIEYAESRGIHIKGNLKPKIYERFIQRI